MKPFWFFSLAILIFSCRQSPVKEKTVFVNDTTHVQDTVIFVKDSAMAADFADSLPNGAYQGMYPCKGCEGIQQTILFTPDKKYKLEELTWGKSSIPKRSEGIWERKSGMVWMYQPGRPPMKFFLKKDSLFTDSLQYALVKRELATLNPSWKQKQNEGVDFIGVGNEPFWSLEIDNEKMIVFKLADWKKPVIVSAVPPIVTKDSTVYNLSSTGSPLRVIVFPRFCSDGMSDFLYQYKVAVSFKGNTYKGCGVVLGNFVEVK
ncbi:MAG TPA: copper resistance protein NlpE N-terminal domain-containing protein [Chitinophagaceae bacterium]|nr:copper resistance protein NlpE N-terminal domain-containing protein [Chitinophagaceae bacterium]